MSTFSSVILLPVIQVIAMASCPKIVLILICCPVWSEATLAEVSSFQPLLTETATVVSRSFGWTPSRNFA